MKAKVVIGVVGSSFGIEGWVRIHSFTDPQENCLDYLPWEIKQQGQWTPIEVTATKRQGKDILAKFAGYSDREAVRQLTNAELGVDKEKLPPAGDNEFYWSDLEGLNVVNKDNQVLGTVERVFSNGANDVLVVMGAKKHLLPYVSHVILSVNLAEKRITVDWDPDF